MDIDLASILGAVAGHGLLVFTALIILNAIRTSKGKEYEPKPYIILGLVISTLNLSAAILTPVFPSDSKLPIFIAYVIVNILMVIILINRKKD